MVVKSEILIVTFTLFVASRTLPINETTPDCPDLPLYPFPKNCSKFVQLGSQGPKEMHCPPGLHFHPLLKICDWPHNAGCVQEKKSVLLDDSRVDFNITNTPLALHHDPNDCETYIQLGQCGDLRLPCPYGLKFNPIKKICDWAKNVQHCITTHEGVEVIEIVAAENENPDGNGQATLSAELPDYLLPGSNCIEKRFFQHPTDCKKFVLCAPYGIHETHCPDDTNFNPETKVCDEKYECLPELNAENKKDNSDKKTNSFEPQFKRFLRPNRFQNRPFGQNQNQRPSRYKPVSTLAYNILHPNPCKKMGNFPHPRSCRKFIMCTERRALVMRCPIGLHFNPQDNSCDLPFYARCPQRLYNFLHPFAALQNIYRPPDLQDLPNNDPNKNTWLPLDQATTTNNFLFPDLSEISKNPEFSGFIPVPSPNGTVNFLPVYEHSYFSQNIFTLPSSIPEKIDLSFDSLPAPSLPISPGVFQLIPENTNLPWSTVENYPTQKSSGMDLNLTQAEKEEPDYYIVTLSKQNVTLAIHDKYMNISFAGGYIVINMDLELDSDTSEHSEAPNPAITSNKPTNLHESNLALNLPNENATLIFTGGYLITNTTSTPIPFGPHVEEETTKQPVENIVFELPKEESVVLFTGGYLLTNPNSNTANRPDYNKEKENNTSVSVLIFDLPKEEFLDFITGTALAFSVSDKNDENNNFNQNLPHKEMTIPFMGGYLISLPNVVPTNNDHKEPSSNINSSDNSGISEENNNSQFFANIPISAGIVQPITSSTGADFSDRNKDSEILDCLNTSKTEIFPFPRDCTKFIKCIDGIPKLQDCLHGTFYTPKEQKCTKNNSYCLTDLLIHHAH